MSFVDSIEMSEMHHPIRVLQRRLVMDSEGAGEHCGAPSLIVELGPTLGSIDIAYVSDGTLNPAQGVCSGQAAGPASQARRNATGAVEPLPAWGHLSLAPGETVISIGTGGGGYGHPFRRSPHKVRDDVLDGRLSRDRAQAVYGVVVNSTGALDLAATQLIRREGSGQ
jgi:N-methylhydantoinase B